MKVTKQDLAKLIQEELDALLSEEDKVISGTDLTQTGGAGVYGGTEGKPITRKQAYDPPESWRDQLSRAIWGAYLPLVGTAMPGDAPLASRYGWVAPPVSRPRGGRNSPPRRRGRRWTVVPANRPLRRSYSVYSAWCQSRRLHTPYGRLQGTWAIRNINSRT
mgnify:CR=1 FL=1